MSPRGKSGRHANGASTSKAAGIKPVGSKARHSKAAGSKATGSKAAGSKAVGSNAKHRKSKRTKATGGNATTSSSAQNNTMKHADNAVAGGTKLRGIRSKGAAGVLSRARVIRICAAQIPAPLLAICSDALRRICAMDLSQGLSVECRW